MSTTFSNADDALGYLRYVFQLPADVTFEQIETEPIGQFGSDLLIEKGEKPDATESDKRLAQSIKDRMAAQITYRPMQNSKEYLFERKDGSDKMAIHFTMGPFRDGVDCWVINEETGMAQRL